MQPYFESGIKIYKNVELQFKRFTRFSILYEYIQFRKQHFEPIGPIFDYLHLLLISLVCLLGEFSI